MNNSGRVIALGFFDGIHLGHAALIDKVLKRAKENNMVPSIVNFDTHPDELIDHKSVKLLSDCEIRKTMLEDLFGITDVIMIHFDEHMMSMNWKDFLDMLVKNYNVSWIVAGYDFTFGHKGEGNSDILTEYCNGKNIGVDIISAVKKDGLVVSSTIIRDFIEDGNISRANSFLGHSFGISGTVIEGYHIGTGLGFPTINLKIPTNVIIPKHGVYATTVNFEDKRKYHGITNVGTRPTFSEDDTVSVETFILNFSGNLYGEKVTVYFHDYIRDEKQFDSPDALCDQIRKDISKAEIILDSI